MNTPILKEHEKNLIDKVSACYQYITEHYPDAPTLDPLVFMSGPNKYSILVYIDRLKGFEYVHDTSLIMDAIIAWGIKLYGWAWQNEYHDHTYEIHHARNDLEVWVVGLIMIITGELRKVKDDLESQAQTRE